MEADRNFLEIKQVKNTLQQKCLSCVCVCYNTAKTIHWDSRLVQEPSSYVIPGLRYSTIGTTCYSKMLAQVLVWIDVYGFDEVLAKPLYKRREVPSYG